MEQRCPKAQGNAPLPPRFHPRGGREAVLPTSPPPLGSPHVVPSHGDTQRGLQAPHLLWPPAPTSPPVAVREQRARCGSMEPPALVPGYEFFITEPVGSRQLSSPSIMHGDGDQTPSPSLLPRSTSPPCQHPFSPIFAPKTSACPSTTPAMGTGAQEGRGCPKCSPKWSWDLWGGQS